MLCRHQIQSMDFSFNNLSIVDDQNFGPLSNLNHLNLSHNQISHIGLFAFSVNSHQITRLDLSHNLITDSSLEFLLFSSLINLKWLSMDHNRLTFLSNHFLYNMYNLEYLSIKNNLLKSLDLFYIVNRNNQFVHHIDLSNNFNLKFQVYQRNSEEVVHENNVQTLILSGIDLSHLDLSIFLDNLFDKYKKLKSLNLSSAGIKSIVWSTKWPQTL
ncbi:insulin-like growth factor-binding complex acid labile subunit, partial [Brachionus plicatilis]